MPSLRARSSSSTSMSSDASFATAAASFARIVGVISFAGRDRQPAREIDG